jgi:hypothetical protein
MKCGLRGAGLGGFLVMAPGANLQDSLDRDTKGLQLLPDDILRHMSAQILNQQMYTTILWDRGVKTHTLAPIKGSQCTDRGSEPSAVCGTSISLSPLIWAESPL